MREAALKRKTNETDIELSLCLDGGSTNISTGVGFFDHMLVSFARHSGFGLNISCKGDTQVDDHHTVEDCGIVLGSAFLQAVGDKRGIARFGSAFIPMDEALGVAHCDVGGRSYLVFSADFPTPYTGSFDAQLIREFFEAFCSNAGVTLHISAPYGRNTHHMAEAMFKAAAYALSAAVKITGSEIKSTKGVL